MFEGKSTMDRETESLKEGIPFKKQHIPYEILAVYSVTVTQQIKQ